MPAAVAAACLDNRGVLEDGVTILSLMQVVDADDDADFIPSSSLIEAHAQFGIANRIGNAVS
jgi:hypothetical protein